MDSIISSVRQDKLLKMVSTKLFFFLLTLLKHECILSTISSLKNDVLCLLHLCVCVHACVRACVWLRAWICVRVFDIVLAVGAGQKQLIHGFVCISLFAGKTGLPVI